MALTEFRHVWRDKGSSRTFLLLHGTGGDENDLIPLGELLDPKANLLSLRGNSTEEGVNRFFRRKAEGVLDEEDIVRQEVKMHLFLADASKEYGFRRDRMLAVGYSNGANMAAALLLLKPSSISGGILLRAMAPFHSPPTVEDTIGPVLILAGARDRMVTSASTSLLEQQLKDRGSQVELVIQPSGHELTQQDVTEARRWLDNLPNRGV